LEGWISKNFQKKGHDGERSAEFKDNILHSAVRIQCTLVAETALILGASIRACLGNRTALTLAAEKGDYPMVQLLATRATEILGNENGNGKGPIEINYMNEEDGDRWTALHVASWNGHADIVELLLDKGADITVRHIGALTALHRAAWNGRLEVIRVLVEKGADVSIRDNTGRTALHWATENGHRSAAELLVEKGSEVIQLSYNEFTALRKAAEKGYEAVECIPHGEMRTDRLNVSSKWAPLHWAAENGHKKLVQLLIEKGFQLDSIDSDGWTALQRAARNGHKGVVRQLLEKGADVDTKHSDEWTALHKAAENGHKKVVRLLIENGADPAAKYSSGWTSIHKAAWNGHKRVVQLLLQEGVGINSKQSDGWTALHMAAEHGKESVVQILIDEGSEINARDSCGRVALQWAAWKGRRRVVQLLLKREESDINTRDDDGWTALHWAAWNGHRRVVRLLIEEGADVNAEDSNGWTALTRAAENGHKPVQQLLIARMDTFQFVTEDDAVHGGEIVRIKDVAVGRKKSQFCAEVQKWVDEVAQNHSGGRVDEDIDIWSPPDSYRQMSKEKWTPSRRIFVYDNVKMVLRVYYPPIHLLEPDNGWYRPRKNPTFD
jgi:ankyrin repeat protein